MNWNKGYSVSYYATIIDTATWKDTERFEVTGGTINRMMDGLRQSANIDCKGWDIDGEPYIRIYMDARQGDTGQRLALMTGLASVPQRSFDGVIENTDVQVYSVLKPLEDILLDRGWYAPTGRAGADIITSLMNIPAPIIIDGSSPVLSEAIIAEEGETNLSMIEKILTAIDWRLRINGDGSVQITPKASEPSVGFDPVNADYIEPSVTVVRDWFECPNVFRATSDSMSGVARDDDLNSPLSTVSRGREIWKEDTASDINTGETIAEYAQRRLKEEQSIATTASYARRFYPDIIPSDIITLNYPVQGMTGTYMIQSQNIALGFAARTNEGVIRL